MFILPRPKSRLAHTLVEILVASTMALLVLGLVAKLLVVSGQASRKGMSKVYLQQRMNRLNSDLQRDIGLSATQGVGLSETQPTYLSIHRRVVETSTVSWEAKVIVYHANDGVLRRDEVNLNPPPTKAYKPSQPGDWTQLLSTGKSSFIFDGLEQFEAIAEANGLLRIKMTFVSGSETLSTERLLRLRQGM